MDSEAQMKAAIEALTAQQAAWQAGNIDLLKAFETRMDAVLDHLRQVGPDGSPLVSFVARSKASMIRNLGATRDSNDDVIERELIALRDAIHYGRGGSREPAPRSAWELIPQRHDNIYTLPPIPAYPEGLDRAAVLAALEPLRDLLPDLVVALDFDGTLSDILPGDLPQDSRALPPTVATLQAISYRVRKLVAITARDPREMVEADRLNGIPGLEVYGHDGLSHWTVGTEFDPYALLSPEQRRGVEQARSQLVAGISPDRAKFQDKTITFEVGTLKVRGTAEEVQADLDSLEAQVRAVADATGLHAVRGNTYWAIRPDGPDKGTSLRDVVTKYDAGGAVYGGDSNNDRPAFEMIQELDAEGIPGVGILSAGTHTSPSLKAVATLEVPGARGVLTVLQELARMPSPR